MPRNPSPAAFPVQGSMRITAELRLASPMQISGLEQGRYDPLTRRIRAGASEGGIPCTLTRKLPVLREAPLETESGFVSRSAEVPVIPASTLCGALRHEAAFLIEDALVAKGQTISPSAFITMRNGSAVTTLRRSEQTLRFSLAAAAHPFFGIFGGTQFAITSNLVVHEGYAFAEESLKLFPWSPLSAIQAAPAYTLTTAIPIVRKNDMLEWDAPERIGQSVGSEAASDYLNQQLAGQVASKARRAAGETGKKEDLRAIACAEAVVPGTWFGLTFDLKWRSLAQAGMMLLALRGLVARGQLGGRKAKGGGRFVVPVCKLRPNGDASEANVFSLAAADGNVALNLENEFIGAAVAAAEEWLETLAATELEAYASDTAPALVAAA